MTWPEIITVAKDILLGLAAATTAIVAALGLRKWRQELEGKAHFEAARNLIRATYRFRDALYDSRTPFYSAHEFPPGYTGILGKHTSEEEVKAWIHIYKNRWAPVMTALQEFDSHTLEAEALWGPTIRTKTNALRQCARELNGAIDADIRNKADGGQHFEKDKKFGELMRSLLAAPREDEKNPLNQQIGRAISGIEEEVRPHLRRS